MCGVGIVFDTGDTGSGPQGDGLVVTSEFSHFACATDRFLYPFTSVVSTTINKAFKQGCWNEGRLRRAALSKKGTNL